MALVLAISLYVPFVPALALSNVNGTAIPTLDVRDSSSSGDSRTLWDIIWSCAATLFACTWTAIHPNIPGVNEGKLVITSRRLFIMVIALIAPELIIAWAARQFFSARKAAKDFNDALDVHPDVQNESILLAVPGTAESKFRAWTVTHGFFAWMGGFLLYVNGGPRATLTPDELRDFIRDGLVDMPDIVQAEIEDRSKGDVLSKGIAVLQLLWFVTQLIARYAQNLPITLLEIDTLAVAVLTSIAYGWWWNKPKDVGHPYPVHWKAVASPPSDLAYEYAINIFLA
ncbi:hypothetical protein M405DRAFT_847143 [Rhizopogon salebrosus TDB-379]|nr:hypothetical protein M405DRAFT_847143 [Rhizopogon salebrosus TDB-379]